MDNLCDALKAYREALLEQALDDLLFRHQGAQRDPSKLEKVMAARARVLTLAQKCPAEDLTGQLMQAGFLSGV